MLSLCHAIWGLDQVEALAARITSQFGQRDILVNNAGAALPYTLKSVTEAACDKSFAVNAKGRCSLIKYLAPLLAQSPAATQGTKLGATVVNVVTNGAFFGTRNQMGYGASKRRFGT